MSRWMADSVRFGSVWLVAHSIVYRCLCGVCVPDFMWYAQFTLKQSSKSNENNERNHLICILGIRQMYAFKLDPFSCIEHDQNRKIVYLCARILTIRFLFTYTIRLYGHFARELWVSLCFFPPNVFFSLFNLVFCLSMEKISCESSCSTVASLLLFGLSSPKRRNQRWSEYSDNSNNRRKRAGESKHRSM